MSKYILLFIFTVSIAQAQWPSSPDTNLLVSRVPNETTSSPAVINDGNNGAIITWLDNRKGKPSIFAQRVDANGALLWDSLDVEITADSAHAVDYSIMSDGLGGAFLLWTKVKSPWWDIYAQKIDGNGQKVWGDTGIVICNASFSQRDVVLTSDEQGGFIVSWMDYRSSTYADIYAQRVDADGNILWTTNGKKLHSNIQEESRPKIIADGFGGAIIIWQSSAVNSVYLYAQKINKDGLIRWGADGLRVSTEHGKVSPYNLVTDNNGGAIISCVKRIVNNGHHHIALQRIDSSGAKVWSDTSDIIINNAWGIHDRTSMLSDGNGGAYLAWADNRIAGFNIYMQHIKADSTSSWTQNGILISDEKTYIPTPHLSPAPNNTVYVAWEDTRTFDNYLWTQRVNPDSTIQWQQEGVATARDVHNYSFHKTMTTDDGHMIMVYTDQSQVYAKRISAAGNLGSPTSIGEVKSNQIRTFKLHQNFPNPFNPVTIIKYELISKGEIKLSVYDLIGRRIKTLVNRKQPAGQYEVAFDASEMASGIYFYTLRANNQLIQTRKMVLMK